RRDPYRSNHRAGESEGADRVERTARQLRRPQGAPLGRWLRGGGIRRSIRISKNMEQAQESSVRKVCWLRVCRPSDELPKRDKCVRGATVPTCPESSGTAHQTDTGRDSHVDADSSA